MLGGKRLLQEKRRAGLLQPCSTALTYVKTLEFFITEKKKNPKPPNLK